MKKRNRAVNFSQEETDELLKQVELKKKVIENKKSDSKTWQEKESAWKAIEFAFNSAIGGPFRDSKHLKIKYEAIKRDIRKKVAYLRAKRYKTGGGTKNAFPLTPTEVKVKEMILDSIEGTESVYDSDSKDEVLIEIAGPSNSINDTIIQIPDTSNKDIQMKNVIGKEKKKTNFKKLIEVQLEVAFLQKRLVEEELEIKAIQKKLLEDDLEQKMQMFDLEMAHKKEIFKLEKQNLLLKIQNLKNKTG